MKTQILHLADFQKLKIMKRLLIAVGVVSILASCGQKKDNQREMLFLTDTTGLYMSNLRADTAIAVEEAPVAVAPVRRTSTAPVRRTTTRSSSVSSGTSSSGTVATAPARKEGWSKAAKGAVIGGVTGAAAGAVIGKNAKGAIIGGVIGAGGGYIIGRSKDKKDGRVQ